MASGDGAFDAAGKRLTEWLDRQVDSDNILRAGVAVIVTGAIVIAMVLVVLGAVAAAIFLVTWVAVGAWRVLTP